jgi:hypothetical protein
VSGGVDSCRRHWVSAEPFAALVAMRPWRAKKRANRIDRAHVGHTSDHLPTQSVVFGRTSAITAEPGPPDRRTAPTHPFDAGFAFGPAPRPPRAAPRQNRHTTPLEPAGWPNEMFGENSRDRKDFLVATSKALSSSSAPQGARRPPLPPGGGRLVSGAGTRGSYERVAPAVMLRLPARALLTGQPSLAMPTSSSNFA